MSDLDYEKLISGLINDHIDETNLKHFTILILTLYRIGKINTTTRNILIQTLYIKTAHNIDWFLDKLEHAKGVMSVIPTNYDTVVYKLISVNKFNTQLALFGGNLYPSARILPEVFLDNGGISRAIWFTQFTVAQDFCDKVNSSNDFNMEFRICPAIIDGGNPVKLNHSKYGYYKILK